MSDYNPHYHPYYGDPDYRGLEEVTGPGGFEKVGDAIARVAGLIEACESPIELQLGAKLKRYLPDGFELVPQFWLARFRMDFAVVRGGKPCLFIECDGQEFHSTPEQRANDLAKNRASAAAGIPMLRFTGSSIFRHSEDCVRQVMAMVKGLA